MTDYFAVLKQQRRPWLDPDALKQAYQKLTLALHPDAADPEKPDAKSFPYSFTDLTEAYRVLSDDKLRLQQLLKLENAETGAGQALPPELMELFPQVGALLQKVDNLLARRDRAQNALSKSLLGTEVLDAQRQTLEFLTNLDGLQEAALGELQSLNDIWATDAKAALPAVQDLYQRFAYLTRWIEQIREREFRLANWRTG
jgi:curved DNA-binding protein CbpA